jgi:uncharacterized DUF497 family protein
LRDDGRFQWDEPKSQANRLKHGIGFEEACAAWDDERGLDEALPFVTEPRRVRIAAVGGKLWFCVYTLRGETVRIISVRRARISEERAYGDGRKHPWNDPQP